MHKYLKEVSEKWNETRLLHYWTVIEIFILFTIIYLYGYRQITSQLQCIVKSFPQTLNGLFFGDDLFDWYCSDSKISLELHIFYFCGSLGITLFLDILSLNYLILSQVVSGGVSFRKYLQHVDVVVESSFEEKCFLWVLSFLIYNSLS